MKNIKLTNPEKALIKALKQVLPYAENEIANLFDHDEDKEGNKGQKKTDAAHELIKAIEQGNSIHFHGEIPLIANFRNN